MLALVSDARGKALQIKATINWLTVVTDVTAYLQQQSKDTWRQTFVPLLQGVVTDQAVQWGTNLGLQFDVENLLASQWFEDYALKFADPISQTTSDGVSEVLQQGMREGWSHDRMSSRLGQMFQQWATGSLSAEDFSWLEARTPQRRTDVIARTESMHASNAGSYQLFKDYGAQKKEWLATADERTRDAHRSANGQVRPMDQPFDVGGYHLTYPGDSSLGAPVSQIAQCRCTVLPVVEEGIEPEPQAEPAEVHPLLDVERAIRNDATESAYAYDADGQLLFKQAGTASEIRFTTEQLAGLRGSTLTHNHPSGANLSPTDVRMVLANGLSESRVVTTEATYSLRVADNNTIGWSDLEARYEAIKRERASHYVREVRSGNLTVDEAARTAEHDIWRLLFSKYHTLTYARQTVSR